MPGAFVAGAFVMPPWLLREPVNKFITRVAHHMSITWCELLASYLLFFHTKLCFVELQNKPKIQTELNCNLWFQSNMNSFITIIKYDIVLFFLFGNYDGMFYRKMTLFIFLNLYKQMFIIHLLRWYFIRNLNKKWLFRTYSLKKYRQFITSERSERSSY